MGDILEELHSETLKSREPYIDFEALHLVAVLRRLRLGDETVELFVVLVPRDRVEAVVL
jgi:hypothetical protein